MTTPYELVEARIYDVLCAGRGTSGMGATAAARAIPANRYRYSRVPLRELNGQAFSRCINLVWLSAADGIPPNSPMFDYQEQRLRLEVQVGYLSGEINAGQTHTINAAEDSTSVVQRVRQTAMGDGFVMLRALTWYELTQGALDAAGTSIIELAVDGESRIEETEQGYIYATPYTCSVWVSNTAAYVPTAP